MKMDASEITQPAGCQCLPECLTAAVSEIAARDGVPCGEVLAELVYAGLSARAELFPEIDLVKLSRNMEAKPVEQPDVPQ